MHPDAVPVNEMLVAARRAIALTEGVSATDLASDRQRLEAVLWNVTVLGEAATRISESTRERFTAVDWRQPVRLRNRVVHGYWSIDVGVVLVTAQERLPDFVAKLAAVYESLANLDE